MGNIAGDLEAHLSGLRRYAMSLTRDANDADDLVQETLRRALTYADGRRTVRDLRAYLFTILHNVRVDTLAQARKAEPLVSLTESSHQLPSLPSQEAYVECKELAGALSRLPEEQHRVIVLVALEGHSYRDAADALGIPLGTVMSRLNRAREALTTMLGGRAGRTKIGSRQRRARRQGR